MPSWNDNTANLPDRENAIRAELSGAAGLPAGGSAGQALIKNSGTDGDASWKAATQAVRSVSSGTSATSADNVILVDATTAGVTVTLPAAASNTGVQLTIRKTDSTTNHNVTITPNGSETINGVTGNFVLRKPKASLEIVSDGVGWQRIGSPLVPNTNVYYVDGTNGNDSNTGRSPVDALKTIGAAVALGPNRIFIMPGTYTETVDLSPTGFNNGISLIGLGGGSPFSQTASGGVVIKAPSAAASALKATGGGQYIQIQNICFSGSGNTYTGTVMDCSNITLGSCFRDIGIVGCPGDDNNAKANVGPGTYGGTGLLLDNMEQCLFENVQIAYCHIGIQAQATTTLSKNILSHFHFSTNFITYKEVAGTYFGTQGLYQNWKVQNNFGLTYAIAQLASNGSNPADGDTVSVRGTTYRFKNTMALANDVKIGASVDATLLSLCHAVNATGTPGTDYFAGTTQPTGVRAGYMNLYENVYGANNGGGTFHLDQTDPTFHACTFQVQDVLGPSGNAYTFAVSSTNLSDFFGLGTFARAAWGVEIQFPNTWDQCDWMENISLPIGNAMLIAGNGSEFRNFKSAPQTQVSITGSNNYFVQPQFQQTCTIQSGALRNVFQLPYSGGDQRLNTSLTQCTDNGTGTVFSMGGISFCSPFTLPYSASINVTTKNGDSFVVTASDGTAFTIGNPNTANGVTSVGEVLTFTIRNTSGGALGVLTWGANYKLATWTQPANGFSRTIQFRYDGTSWIEISRTPSDVPN